MPYIISSRFFTEPVTVVSLELFVTLQVPKLLLVETTTEEQHKKNSYLCKQITLNYIETLLIINIEMFMHTLFRLYQFYICIIILRI